MEIEHKLRRGVELDDRRLRALCRSLERLPWDVWHMEPPPLLSDDIRDFEDALHHWKVHTWTQAAEDVVQHSKHALKQWKQRMADAADGKALKPLSAWLRGRNSSTAIWHNDQPVVDPVHVAATICSAWKEELAPDNMPPPMDDQYANELISFMPKATWTMPPLDPDELAQVAASKALTSSGLDSISLQMMNKLPRDSWCLLTSVLSAVEVSGSWPFQLLEVLAVPIPKAHAEGLSPPKKLRILSIASHVYRLWATYRARQLSRHWLVHILDADVYGGLPFRSARVAATAESLAWDAAALRSQSWQTLYLDASKCFDHLRWSDILRFAVQLGCPQQLIAAVCNWLAGHKRRFQVMNSLSSELSPKRGIPQGCPLAVSWACLWGSSWAAKIRAHVCDLVDHNYRLGVYLDDFSFAADRPQLIKPIMGLTVEHFTQWALTINVAKSSVLFSARSSQGENPADLQVGELSTPESHVMLGHDVGWKPGRHIGRQRIGLAQTRLDRLQLLALNKDRMLKLIGIYVAPVLFGIDTSDFSEAAQRLERHARTLVWGTARHASVWPAALAFDLPSHHLHAGSKAFVDSASALHNMATFPHLRSMVMLLWNARYIPRVVGIWASFIRGLTHAKLYLGNDGAVVDSNNVVLAHLNQARQTPLDASSALLSPMELVVPSSNPAACLL